MYRLDRLVDNIQTRLNNLEALSIKIAGLEESQEHISKEFEDQKRNLEEIMKSKKQLENENAQLNSKINNFGKLESTEQEKRVQLERYGIWEMIEIRGVLIVQGGFQKYREIVIEKFFTDNGKER